MVGSKVLSSEGFRLHRHPASFRRFDETVVFIHHFQGSNKTPWRHYRYLNDKGFDCITFDLLLGSDQLKVTDYHSFYRYLPKGVFYIWKRQIQDIFDSIEGNKIAYGFSGPALSMLWACQERSDIKKVVCDGGPFDNIYQNSRRMFEVEKGISNPLLNKVSAAFGTAAWGYRPVRRLHQILKNWNLNVPILSIRGIIDPIVQVDSIRRVFAPHTFLNIQTLELRFGKHLDGLRDFPEEYCKTLLPFIKEGLNQKSKKQFDTSPTLDN